MTDDILPLARESHNITENYPGGLPEITKEREREMADIFDRALALQITAANEGVAEEMAELEHERDLLAARIAELEAAYKRGWVSEDTDKLFRDVSVCFDLVWNMQCADGFHPVVAKNFQVYLQRIKDAYRGVEVKRNEAMNVGIELEERVAELKANQIPGRCADCRWCYDDLDMWRCMTGGHRGVKPTDFCSSWEARDEPR